MARHYRYMVRVAGTILMTFLLNETVNAQSYTAPAGIPLEAAPGGLSRTASPNRDQNLAMPLAKPGLRFAVVPLAQSSLLRRHKRLVNAARSIHD